MTELYDYWRTELNLPGSQTRMLDENFAIDGWWRMRGAKTKTDYPVVIWTDDKGKVWGKVGRAMPFEKNSDQWYDFQNWSWPHCEAVLESEYQVAMKDGAWADGKRSRSPQKPKPDEITEDSWLGNENTNNPPPEEALRDRLDVLTDAVFNLNVTDQKSANKAAELEDRLRDLWNEGDLERKKEKAPHQREVDKVQAKWRPLLEDAGIAGASVKAKRKAWLKAEQDRIDAKASTEPTSGRSDFDGRQYPEEKAMASSAYGRAKGLVTRRKGIIVDRAKFIKAIGDRSDFIKELQRIADLLARSNTPTKGLEIKEEKE